MRLIDSYRLAHTNLFRSRTRSFLTIFGVVVGVSAIVLLVSLAAGIGKITTEKIASIDVLTTIDVSKKENSNAVLNKSALEKFAGIENVERVSPSLKTMGQIKYQNTTTSAVIYGVRSEDLSFEGLDLETGEDKFLSNKDIIMSRSLLKTLGSEEPVSDLNKEVEISLINIAPRLPEEIKEKMIISGVDRDETIGVAYVSLEFLGQKLGKDNFDSIKVKVKNKGAVKEVKSEIESRGYNATTVTELISQIESVFLILEIVFGIIGGIGLLVASIGIINTMTIALLERTHEIGIMKALGASSSDVRRIFLSEAVLISFLGGVIGLVVGVSLGFLLNLGIKILMEMAGEKGVLEIFATPWQLIVLLVIIMIAVGFLTGLYPARRAAKLSPLRALHIE